MNARGRMTMEDALEHNRRVDEKARVARATLEAIADVAASAVKRGIITDAEACVVMTSALHELSDANTRSN